MHIKTILSLLLTILLSYLIFQMHHQLVAGLNPYLSKIFNLIPIIPFVVNGIVISTIKEKRRRKLLWSAMLLGVLTAVAGIVLYKPALNNGPARRYYTDSIVPK